MSAFVFGICGELLQVEQKHEYICLWDLLVVRSRVKA
jgi:hypothetical protein